MIKKYFYEKNVKMFLVKKYEILWDDKMAMNIDGVKPMTVKLYKPTHAKLKIFATIHDQSLDDAIEEILNEISNIDITKFVEEGLKKIE